jgi:hypothetical protein
MYSAENDGPEGGGVSSGYCSKRCYRQGIEKLAQGRLSGEKITRLISEFNGPEEYGDVDEYAEEGGGDVGETTE